MAQGIMLMICGVYMTLIGMTVKAKDIIAIFIMKIPFILVGFVNIFWAMVALGWLKI